MVDTIAVAVAERAGVILVEVVVHAMIIQVVVDQL